MCQVFCTTAVIHFHLLQLKALNSQLDDKNIEIRDIRLQVQRNNEKIHLQEKDISMNRIFIQVFE